MGLGGNCTSLAPGKEKVIPKVKYINSRNKVIIICNIHGEFLQTPSSHIQGYQCNKCAISTKRLTTNNFIEKSVKLHGDKWDYSKVEYINTRNKVIIICKDHGEFLQTPNSHLSGSACKKTYGELYEQTLKKEQKIKDLGYNLVTMWEYDWNQINRSIKKLQLKFKSRN